MGYFEDITTDVMYDNARSPGPADGLLGKNTVSLQPLPVGDEVDLDGQAWSACDADPFCSGVAAWAGAIAKHPQAGAAAHSQVHALDGPRIVGSDSPWQPLEHALGSRVLRQRPPRLSLGRFQNPPVGPCDGRACRVRATTLAIRS